MKKILSIFLAVFMAAVILPSCETVPAGHTAVGVSYGGETDTAQVYPEGFHFGLRWVVDDMVNYETREMTYKASDVYLDRDGLKVPIDVIVYYRPMKSSVNRLHKEHGPNYVQTKVSPAVDAAMKNVVPQYRALELNSTYREEADQKLKDHMKNRFLAFYAEVKDVNITRVDIPEQISAQIVEKQVQDERNSLAEKKELESYNLGRAQLVKDSLGYEAAKYQANTMKVLSTPQNLALKQLEIQEIEARGYEKHGSSKFGTGNVFGGGAPAVIKGLK